MNDSSVIQIEKSAHEPSLTRFSGLLDHHTSSAASASRWKPARDDCRVRALHIPVRASGATCADACRQWLVGFLFAASGPLAIIVATGSKGGLSEADLASWVFGSLAVNGVVSILFSLKYRQPLVFFWTIPGTVLIAPALGHLTFPQVIGAYLATGALMLALGALGWVQRAMRAMPMPIVMGMVAGVFLQFGPTGCMPSPATWPLRRHDHCFLVVIARCQGGEMAAAADRGAGDGRWRHAPDGPADAGLSQVQLLAAPQFLCPISPWRQCWSWWCRWRSRCWWCRTARASPCSAAVTRLRSTESRSAAGRPIVPAVRSAPCRPA